MLNMLLNIKSLGCILIKSEDRSLETLRKTSAFQCHVRLVFFLLPFNKRQTFSSCIFKQLISYIFLEDSE
jgi:hypothetical protein